MIKRLARWWKNKRRPPVVVIAYGSELTERPKVHVSVIGMSGSQGVYTYDATEQGDACATLYGRGLADIMQRKLIDQRGRKP